MFITPLPQLLRLLLYTFLLGIALGVLYDFFRIIKVAVLGGERKDGVPDGTSAPEKRKGKVRKRGKRRGTAPETDAETAKRSRHDPPRPGGAKAGGRRHDTSGFIRELPGFLLHFVTDLLFFFFAAVVTVIFFYAFHRGKIRLSAIFTLAAGFALYYFTVGRLVYALAEKIVNAVRRAIRFALAHTVLPLGRAIGKGIAALYTLLRRKILRRKMLVLSEREEKAFLELAGRGFGIDAAGAAKDPQAERAK